MKLQPEQWTHHHIHRLYHLSIALCFSFVTMAVSVGLMTSQSPARADSISGTNDVSIMASVPEISPGPIVPGGGGGGGGCVPNCTPPGTGLQTITIIPEPRGQIPQKEYMQNGQNIRLYTFPTQYPSFSGTTSIPNALIFLIINTNPPLYSTARATSSGQWIWLSPVVLSNSLYNISVTAQAPTDDTVFARANLDFAVATTSQQQKPQGGGTGTTANPPSGSGASHSGPLNIFLEIPGLYKTINAGQKVLANIELVNNDPKHTPAPQDIAYRIENAQHETILEATDTVTLDKSVNFSKTFLTNPGARSGEYTVIGKIENKMSTAAASDTFTIRELKHPVTSGSNASKFIDWIQILGIIILLLFALIAAIAYHNAHLISRAIRHEQELHALPPELGENEKK